MANAVSGSQKEKAPFQANGPCLKNGTIPAGETARAAQRLK